MNDKNNLLRSLPKVDELLDAILAENPELARNSVKWAIQEVIAAYRERILCGEVTAFTGDEIHDEVRRRLAGHERNHLRRVINATGVILHTNLGRARLSSQCRAILDDVASGYSNLEYDLETGGRGSRYDHVAALLTRLTGAEAALVVNNNAGALTLVLSALTAGQEVVVSRGELVEIGGSFRVPEIMAAGGSILREVGTTNKTHPADYSAAIGENTGALLKVHTSNYKIIGFTEAVGVKEMADLAHDHDLPLIYDQGSGALINLAGYGVQGEVPVPQAIADGADLVCFSGDKLLGGPQAGIIVGRSELVDRLKKHPLTRALRIDKLTLSALEMTLRQYIDPEMARKTIPTLRMITEHGNKARLRANELSQRLEEIGFDNKVVECASKIGGGTSPETELPSFAVAVVAELSPDQLAQQLRRSEVPVIVRIADDAVLLDMRTVDENEITAIVAAFAGIRANLEKEGTRGI